MKEEYYIVSSGMSPPWNEGHKVLARNYTNLLSRMYGNSFKVISVPAVAELLPKNFNFQYLRTFSQSLHNTLKLCGEVISNVREKHSIIHLMNVNYSVAVPMIKVLKQCRIIVYIPQVETDYFSQWLLRLNLRITRFYSTFADVILATSPIIRDKLLTLGVASIHIPPPINTEFFKPIDKKLALKIFGNVQLDESDVILLYIGNLTPTRFPHHYIFSSLSKLAKSNLPFKLLIFAPKFQINYDRYEKLSRSIKQFKLEKHVLLFIRNLSEKEKLALYNISDVFLFPALTSQGIDPPLTILEAMSCGKVVFATPVQSLPYEINHMNNGILIYPNSLDQYYLMLLKLYKDIDFYKQMGMNARRSILNSHSFSVISQKIRKLHQMLMT